MPFNPQRKVIDLDPAQKAAIVKKMYQKAGIVLGAPKSDGKALHALAAKGSYGQHEANGQADTPAKKIGALLDAFCGNDRPRRVRALREALNIAEGPLPTLEEYTDDDALKVELYVDSQKKAKAGK